MNDLLTVENKDVVQVNPYDNLIQIALSKDLPIEKLEKMLELKERHEKNEARKAYHKAMAEFKKNPPEIEKDKHVYYESSKGATSYNHASLGNVTTKINSALGEHGLSASWKTEQIDGVIKVTCIITHELGYSESTSLSSQSDTSGGKNNIQGIGSAVSYLQRYTILALTGLATKEQDNDGMTSEIEYISEEQVANINAVLDEFDEEKKKHWMDWILTGAESIEKIQPKDYDFVVKTLGDAQ